jgi:diacylglycerol kinase
MPEYLHLTHHTVSFKRAFEGIRHTFRTQPNLRIHLVTAIIVLIFGVYFGLSRFEWLLILFTIMWVITAEMLNTSLESIVNLITHEYRQEAKIAKDVAAGMVLIGALGAVIVGLVIFTPYLLKLLIQN